MTMSLSLNQQGKMGFGIAEEYLLGDRIRALPIEIQRMIYGLLLSTITLTLDDSDSLIAEEFPNFLFSSYYFFLLDNCFKDMPKHCWLRFDLATPFITFLNKPALSKWHHINHLHLRIKDAYPKPPYYRTDVNDPLMDWDKLFDLDPVHCPLALGSLFLEVEYRVRDRFLDRFIEDKKYRDCRLRRPLELRKFAWRDVSVKFKDLSLACGPKLEARFARQLEKQIKAGRVLGCYSEDFKASMPKLNTHFAGSLWNSVDGVKQGWQPYEYGESSVAPTDFTPNDWPSDSGAAEIESKED